MNKKGNYTLHLYNMKDLVITKGDKKYVYLSVIAQRLKAVDHPETSVLYRRWFQLIQFTFNVETVYGLPALDITSQVKKGHSSSLRVEIHITSGKDCIK